MVKANKKKIMQSKLKDLMINKFDIQKAAIKLSPYLNEDPETISNKLSKGRYVELINDISEKEQYDLLNSGVAEVEFSNVWRRVFPNKALASHVIGYSNRDFDENSSAGLERWIYKNNIQSENIYLSLNLNVQNYLEKALFEAIEIYEAKAGFGVILNAKNGEIVALASLPNYDPNKLINKPNAEYWKNILENTLAPLTNRAIQGLYAPGSTFKIVVALAALEKKLINKDNELHRESNGSCCSMTATVSSRRNRYLEMWWKWVF